MTGFEEHFVGIDVGRALPPEGMLRVGVALVVGSAVGPKAVHVGAALSKAKGTPTYVLLNATATYPDTDLSSNIL